jgi:diphthine synthase
MVLYLIGLGLGDEKDVTVKGMEAIQSSSRVYLEAYTSVLGGGSVEGELPEQLHVSRMERAFGCSITVADRQMCEDGADEIIEAARSADVSFLVIGDAFGATTHTDLLLRAHEVGVSTSVVHNASIMNAIGCCGLQLYNYGQAVSICFFRGPGTVWPDEAPWRPSSFYSKIAANRVLGLHTLCLLDIKVKEPQMEALARGKLTYEPPRYMSVNCCIEQLLAVEAEERAAGRGGAYGPGTLCVGLAKVGCEGQRIVCGTMEQLRTVDFGPPLHSFVIPGTLHDLETSVLQTFALPDQAHHVAAAAAAAGAGTCRGGAARAALANAGFVGANSAALAASDSRQVAAAVAHWDDPVALQAIITAATGRLVALCTAGGSGGSTAVPSAATSVPTTTAPPPQIDPEAAGMAEGVKGLLAALDEASSANRAELAGGVVEGDGEAMGDFLADLDSDSD